MKYLGQIVNKYDLVNKFYVDSAIENKANVLEGTVLSPNADFAEIGEWSDGNPDNEDRLGYFVAVDKTEAGITMVKANSLSDVRGVTMEHPGFSGNASHDKFDENGNLLPKYSYVGFAGFVSVIDNGRCAINGRCMPDDDGTAIPSANTMGYQIIDRIDEMHVLLLVEPGADMLNRIKTDVDLIEMVAKTQADWAQTDENAVDFIKNKPILPSIATNTVMGIVKGSTANNHIHINADGTMLVNSLDISRLIQTTDDKIIWTCGTSKE